MVYVLDKRKFFPYFQVLSMKHFKMNNVLWFQDRLQNFLFKTGIKIGSNKAVNFLLIKENSRTYICGLFIINTYKF